LFDLTIRGFAWGKLKQTLPLAALRGIGRCNYPYVSIQLLQAESYIQSGDGKLHLSTSELLLLLILIESDRRVIHCAMLQQVGDNFGPVPALRRVQRRFPGAGQQSLDGPRPSENLRILLNHFAHSIQPPQAGGVLQIDGGAMGDQDFRGSIVAGAQSGAADAIGIEQRRRVQRRSAVRVSCVDRSDIA
jgi:hypothetical protein